MAKKTKLKVNKNKVLNLVFTLLLIICFATLIYQIKVLNILPFKYEMIVYISIGVVSLLFLIAILLLRNKIINVLLNILKILCYAAAVYGIYNIGVTNRFLENINTWKETTNYYVIVNKTSSYKKITDLKKKNIGELSMDKEGTAKANKLLKKEIKFTIKEEDSIRDLVLDLYDDKIDAIFVNSGISDIYSENDETFKEKTRVVDTISVVEEKKEEKKEEIKVEEPKETKSILISGIDMYGNIGGVSRSDVNIIATVNPVTHEVLLTSIPRDTYVQLHNTTGLKDKLTHSGIYGVNMTKETLEDFLNIKIDYYVRINFSTLEMVIDAIGGVDVYSDVEFGEGGYHYNQGWNHLDGKNALMYARIRHVFAEGVRKREQHQKEIIDAVIKKVSSTPTLITNYETILNSLTNFFQSDVPGEEIKLYAKYQLDKSPSWTTKSIEVTGDGQWDTETYSMPGWGLWVLMPYEDTVNYCSSMINGMKEGKSFAELESIPVPESIQGPIY